MRRFSRFLAVSCLVGGSCGQPGGHGGSTDGGASSGPTGSASVTGPGTASADSSDGSGAATSTVTSGSSATDGATTGGSTTGDIHPANPCPPLDPPTGTIIMLAPSDAANLPDLVSNAAAGTTLVLADGTYDLSGGNPLHVTTPSISIRSASGNRDAVVLDGGYAVGEVFLVEASNFLIADLTVQRAAWHPIHVTGGATANTEGARIYNVKVLDPGQQAIKINASGAGHYADNGEVACSHVEMTDAGRTQVSDCYTGGIDAHSAWGWVVRDNVFSGFWCEQGLSEHAIHFWVTARDTLVERNRIHECARGIGFGLGENGNGNQRVYPDDPCPGASYLGHVDGIIRNNFISAARPELFASQFGFDSGVALEQACGTRIVHNTVAATQTPFVSIEYRFANTTVTLENNLVTHTIVAREGGQATLDGNLDNQPLSHFVDAASGDLHLTPDSPAVNAGAMLTDALASDVDGDAREDGSADVGADEVSP